MTLATVGRVVVDCSVCPQPVHLALVADPERVDADGLLVALDAVGAGVPLALRVHFRQHGLDAEEDE